MHVLQPEVLNSCIFRDDNAMEVVATSAKVSGMLESTLAHWRGAQGGNKLGPLIILLENRAGRGQTAVSGGSKGEGTWKQRDVVLQWTGIILLTFFLASFLLLLLPTILLLGTLDDKYSYCIRSLYNKKRRNNQAGSFRRSHVLPLRKQE